MLKHALLNSDRNTFFIILFLTPSLEISSLKGYLREPELKDNILVVCPA